MNLHNWENFLGGRQNKGKHGNFQRKYLKGVLVLKRYFWYYFLQNYWRAVIPELVGILPSPLKRLVSGSLTLQKEEGDEGLLRCSLFLQPEALSRECLRCAVEDYARHKVSTSCGKHGSCKKLSFWKGMHSPLLHTCHHSWRTTK